MQKFLTFGMQHRLLSLAILAVITLLCGAGLSHLRVDTSFDSLISDTDPTKVAYEAIKDEFGSDNTTIIYLRSSKLWTESHIEALESMHYALEDLPFVEKVDSLFSVRSIRDSNGMIESSTVLDGVPVGQAEIDDARARALYSPLVVGNFISTDGLVTAINVSIIKDKSNPDFDRMAYEAMQKAIDPYIQGFDQAFQVGPPRVNEDTKTGLFSDLSLLIPLSLGVLIASIVAFLRNGLATIIPVTTSGIGLVWAFGLMGHFGVPINILSAMVPSLVIVIGSTEDTHMLASYLSGLPGGSITGSRAERRRQATLFMIRHLGLPLILTTLTTTLGFAANITAEMGLVRDFAFAASLAVAANGVITLALVPVMLMTFGPLRNSLKSNKTPDGEPDQLRGVMAFILRLCQAAANYRRTVLLVTTAIVALFGVLALDTKVSNDPIAFFKADHPLAQDVNTLAEDLSGMEIFYINIGSSVPNAFRNPENLQRLAAIKRYIEQDGRFDTVISLADMLSLVNREFHGGDAAMMTVPESTELVDQYLLFFQRSDLESYISPDFKRANMVVRHNIHDSHRLKEAVASLQAEVERIAGPDLSVHLVGQNLMINAAAEKLLTAQIQSVGLLLVVIFIIMSLVYTSVIGGLLSLAPNVVPIVIVFGLMGLFGIPLNPGTATVAVIAIGIAVDDTIHLLASYAQESRLTADRMLAVRRTVTQQAVPAISTSVALTAGFLVLMGSNFTILSQFGMLAAVAMIMALIADLIVTPVLMSYVRLVGLYDILSLRVGAEIFTNSPLFANMTPYQVRKAILLTELMPFEKGQRVLEQGTQGRDMYLILSGKVAVSLERDGKVTRLASLGEGAVLGEVGFVREQERTASVDALSDGEMLVFNAEKLQRNMRLYPHIANKLNLNIAAILGARLAETTERLSLAAETENG